MPGLLLGVLKKLQILNRGAGLGGKGQHNLFVQFAEAGSEAVRGQFVGKREPAEELATASNRHSEERGHGGMIFVKSEGGPVFRAMTQGKSAVLLSQGFPRVLFERECPDGLGRNVIDSAAQELSWLTLVVAGDS